MSRGATSGPAANIAALACAASAGVHAGLVPAHLSESPPLGVSFGLAAALLLLVGAAFVVRPSDPLAARGAQLLIASLLAAYLASRTAGIPLLQPEPKHTDALGIATKAVEVLALICALRLGQIPGGHRPPLTQEVAP